MRMGLWDLMGDLQVTIKAFGQPRITTTGKSGGSRLQHRAGLVWRRYRMASKRG